MLTSARTAVIPLCSLLENENINRTLTDGHNTAAAAGRPTAKARRREATPARWREEARRAMARGGQGSGRLGEVARARRWHGTQIGAQGTGTGTLTLSRVYIYSVSV